VDVGQYLDILRRRLIILVSVPALALGLVVGHSVTGPGAYSATATVAAPALVGGATANQYSGANGLKSFVANFSAALTSPPILDKVTSETGVGKGKIKSGLSATQIGNSSVIEVTYSSASRNAAGPVAKAAASDTMVFLFTTQVQLAAKPVDSARKAVSDTETQMAALTRQNGLVLPDKDYEVRAQEIASLQSAQAQATANGQAATAAALQTTIAAKQAALAQLAPTVQQYQSLLDQKAQALTNLNQAQQSLQQAQAQLAAADPSKVVSLAGTQRQSLFSAFIQKGTVAAGAGLLLALAIVALLELVPRRRFAGAPRRAPIAHAGRPRNHRRVASRV
jgi:capsular polysaccharide biosynthesis protein